MSYPLRKSMKKVQSKKKKIKIHTYFIKSRKYFVKLKKKISKTRNSLFQQFKKEDFLEFKEKFHPCRQLLLYLDSTIQKPQRHQICFYLKLYLVLVTACLQLYLRLHRHSVICQLLTAVFPGSETIPFWA